MLEPVQGTANDQNVDPAEKTDGEFSEHSHSNGTDQPTNGSCYPLFLTLADDINSYR